ncbi:MAG: PepSY domain-containing protein [Gemmatimonadaceae bacterium]
MEHIIMKHAFLAIALAAGAFATAGAQQAPTYKRHMPPALVRAARVTEAQAVATAQSILPAGKIEALELEREGGKIIYSFDMKVAGKSGTAEVNVDAATGKQVGKVQYESAANERKEAAQEQAAPKKKGGGF